MIMLGQCYHHGLGVAVNIIEAMRYYTLAAHENHPDAIEHIAAVKELYKEAVRLNYTALMLPLIHMIIQL